MGCNIGFVGRKVADTEGEVHNLVDGLRRDIFESYANIRQNGNETILAVGSRLRDRFHGKAQ